jgi:phage terminase Nu1 subunit (DNA packaging protein)
MDVHATDGCSHYTLCVASFIVDIFTATGQVRTVNHLTFYNTSTSKISFSIRNSAIIAALLASAAANVPGAITRNDQDIDEETRLYKIEEHKLTRARNSNPVKKIPDARTHFEQTVVLSAEIRRPRASTHTSSSGKAAVEPV